MLGPVFAVAIAVAPCAVAKPDCVEWVKPASQAAQVQVYRTYSLESRNEKVTRAFVFVHGILRDADNHFRTALAGAFLAGALDDTVIVVPRFASNSSAPGNEAGDCRDSLAPEEANWICESGRPDTWRSGGMAVGNEQLTSFGVMDEIVRRLANKDVFPNLRTIVIAGHSAGGQFVVRYAMLNQVHEKAGPHIIYLVANPSSYAYVDDLRPTPNTVAGAITTGPQPVPPSSPSRFAAFGAKSCPGYNVWPYGLEGRPAYASNLSDAQVAGNFASRDVTYLLGEADVLPLGVFDTSCAAMAQGENRLKRGLAFYRYALEDLHAQHHAVVVPFCSHSQRCMFTADVALPLMFPK